MLDQEDEPLPSERAIYNTFQQFRRRNAIRDSSAILGSRLIRSSTDDIMEESESNSQESPNDYLRDSASEEVDSQAGSDSDYDSEWSEAKEVFSCTSD